jgi:putative restriction endonuclease
MFVMKYRKPEKGARQDGVDGRGQRFQEEFGNKCYPFAAQAIEDHMPRRDWTREELIVTFNLYCKIPFGRIHLRNPQVIELARMIGRTPSAVSWKLANFARLDPALQKRNIVGATHGARAEVEIWDEFNNDWEALSFESERLLQLMTGRVVEPAEEDARVFPEGRTRDSVVRARVNQGFFRSVVLAAYGYRCCITGLSIPQLLNASHIVPWSVDVKNRTNPRNGLCLNAIHDRAFDCGLLTMTPDLKVRISPKVKENSSDVGAQELLLKYKGVSVSLPRHFAPEPEFLKYHQEQVFQES